MRLSATIRGNKQTKISFLMLKLEKMWILEESWFATISDIQVILIPLYNIKVYSIIVMVIVSHTYYIRMQLLELTCQRILTFIYCQNILTSCTAEILMVELLAYNFYGAQYYYH